MDHKLRSIERLVNKELLGEFLTDKGAKLFAQQDNFNGFITALGSLGKDLTIKKRNHPVIAYYVPLHLNTSNLTNISEIEEVNSIQEGDLLCVWWAKLPICRNANQTCGHLILTFSNPNAANRAKTGGLIICNKRVSVSKYKKEPIQCLKCQGWNHIASKCIRKMDLCGTCRKEGHRMSDCKAISKQHCVSCNSDDHPSWAQHCPTFVRKCREFDQKHPENGLPFYPLQEPWTWAHEPPKPDQQTTQPPLTHQIPI